MEEQQITQPIAEPPKMQHRFVAGLLAFVVSVVLTATVGVFGLEYIIYYFQIPVGLGGLFLPFTVLLFGVPTNLVFWNIMSWIFRHTGQRIIRTMVSVAILDVIIFAGYFGFYYMSHSSDLTRIAAVRHNASVLGSGHKTIASCNSVNTDYLWASCVEQPGVIKTESDLQTCIAGAKSDHAYCYKGFAVTSRQLSICNQTQGDIERECIYALTQGRDGVTPLTHADAVTQCSAITVPLEKNYCFFFVLEQLSKGDSLIPTICQNIDQNFIPANTGQDILVNLCGRTTQ